MTAGQWVTMGMAAAALGMSIRDTWRIQKLVSNAEYWRGRAEAAEAGFQKVSKLVLESAEMLGLKVRGG